MSIQIIFILQFSLSLLVFSLLTKWYLTTWMAKKPLHTVVMLLLIPHTFRHIGMSFLVPSLNVSALSTSSSSSLLLENTLLPASFALPAAYGDLLSGLLACLAMLALMSNWKSAVTIVWIFSIIGIADLFNALRQVEAISAMGATWFIPTFLVPMLLVTHAVIVFKLIKKPIINDSPAT